MSGIYVLFVEGACLAVSLKQREHARCHYVRSFGVAEVSKRGLLIRKVQHLCNLHASSIYLQLSIGWSASITHSCKFSFDQWLLLSITCLTTCLRLGSQEIACHDDRRRSCADRDRGISPS